ncbi:DUF397 domain-containing protein [Streptomyces sp. RKND-216]|uniref:DUF397 domain-containing protein n=1 Tax=Streptomyces sp. RKND-216 TaxID=2562581 RepID=UPI00109E2049|nr:DUF397 domain-containing protein [Streptomyces sp. RKND-216]THA26248.1 DUF397 domain-containing protein [Streptomyces sp. RKND-216]
MGNAAEAPLAYWRKSSYSGSDGGECVEVAAQWRKSSYSGSQGGDCVEVAQFVGEVSVRDSKNPSGPVLAFPATAFEAFTSAAREGAFDA